MDEVKKVVEFVVFVFFDPDSFGLAGSPSN